MQEQEEKKYRVYLTDVLMMISENTARAVNNGRYVTGRWIEGFKKQNTRTGDEIARDVLRGAGLTLKGGER